MTIPASKPNADQLLLAGLPHVKSTYSSGGSGCLAVAFTQAPDGRHLVGLQDDKLGAMAPLFQQAYSAAAWTAFVGHFAR